MTILIFSIIFYERLTQNFNLLDVVWGLNLNL